MSTDKKDEKEIKVFQVYLTETGLYINKIKKEAKAKKKQNLIKSESEQCITSNFLPAK